MVPMSELEPEPMSGGAESETSRVEAFSDGVLAVIITIMALELRAPAGAGLSALRDRVPNLLVYVLSFTFVGIYWNNHHHLLRAARKVSGAVMWSNLHLLFWLSLIPVLTEWVADQYRHPLPAAVYGVVGLGAAGAWALLLRAIARADGPGSTVVAAVGNDTKGTVSLVAYAAGVGLAYVSPWVSYALYAAVAVMWIVPDRRFERASKPA
jgi:uncharacterized membrane protein